MKKALVRAPFLFYTHLPSIICECIDWLGRRYRDYAIDEAITKRRFYGLNKI